MLITPAQAHIRLAVLPRAGAFASRKVGGPPGIQGAMVTGWQGMGVSTPSAVAVAAATCGLARLMHMPKGGMLTKGA